MRKASTLFQAFGLIFGLLATPALSRGLEELSEKNPESAAPETEEPDSADSKQKEQDVVGEDGEAKDGADEAIKVTPSAISSALKGKAFLFTSVGWVRASQSGGEWSSNGFSDFGFGYQVLSISETIKLNTTYRYNPIAVTGVVNNHSYRGVWETHNFGGFLKFGLPKKFAAVAIAELGYLRSHLQPTDGLPPESRSVKHGVSLTLGGGGDYKMTDSGEFTLGPRLYLGLGAATQLQFGLSAGFGF